MEESQPISRERSLVFSIYLVAVFLNAFVDLGHKIIIQNTIFMIYGEQQQIILTAVVNAMILVPFILLFTMSGYLSDRFAKTSVMRFSAFSAVLITLGITYCYYNGLYKTTFGFTLLLATQSAIYSPAKMGYIKECLSKAGLSKGNAYHSAVVLIAILATGCKWERRRCDRCGTGHHGAQIRRGGEGTRGKGAAKLHRHGKRAYLRHRCERPCERVKQQGR